MSKKSQEYLCVSLSEETLRIAQVKSAPTFPKVSKVFSEKIKGKEPEELLQIVQAALKGFNTKATAHICIVPTSLATTKNIEIPSTNPEEIRSIVNLQAGRHTPFSRDEIQIGFINNGIYKGNYTKVLLAIVNRNNLKKHLSVFEKSGLKIKQVLFSPEGIASFYSNIIGQAEGNAPVAVVDVGQNSTDFVILTKGTPIASRNIPVGKKQLAEQGIQAEEKLVEELKNTLDSYQSEDIDVLPAKFILTSDDESIRSLQTTLQGKFSWACEIVPYVDSVKASQGVLQQLATDFPDVSFLGLVSSACAAADAEINFIPEEVQLQKSVEDQSKELYQAAILALAVIVIVAATLSLKMFFGNHFYNKLKSKYSSERAEVKRLEKLSSKSAIIRDYLNSRMISLDVINELSAKLPGEVYLTNMFVEEDGSISIQGISDIASIVFNLGTTLKDSELFKSVEIKSTTAKKDRGKDVSAFEISLKLASADDDVIVDNNEEGE